MIVTLEEFLEDQCGMVTPLLLDLFEPHRIFVENTLEQYDDKTHSWKKFAGELWLYLPDPDKDLFMV